MKKFKEVEVKPNLPELEEKILKFWQDKKIFEKSIAKNPKSKEFVFYDGPPFATGLPHYGHIVPGTVKDIFPRYKTMRGYRVERRFGWDCHGLPIEYQLEKELKINSKKEIERMGVDKFNEQCRSIVLRYVNEWEQIIPRLGRWVDFKNDYKTMDPKYMESIWWVFNELWEKHLIYEGYKSLHICPRCVTPLSNFEVTLGYKNKKDVAVTVKFPLKKEKNTFILGWTTTPWTLPANVLLAVNPKSSYVKVTTQEGVFILAAKRVKEIFKDKEINRIEKIKIKNYLDCDYEPLFPLAKDGKRYKLIAAQFVNLKEGTGVVHIAPAFGEDDYRIGQQEKAAFVQHINENGLVNHLFKEYQGTMVWDLNFKVIKDLDKRQLLFDKNNIVHSYPFCWRCETPLLNYATKTWFVKVTKIKESLLKNNQKITWVPKNVKNGRFGMWLKGARDWGISRNRFWGTPIPVWRGQTSGVIEVIGSISELEAKIGKKVSDLHLHKIRELTWKNKKTGETMRLSGEVLDCWFESGSMPYAFNHYPFENKVWFENHFPANFIAESIDQTRGWFYTLHVLATAIFDKPAFKNVITNGVVLAEDGQKMSKSKKNFPDPMVLVHKYGADALRLYLMGSVIIKGEDLCFSEKGVLEIARNVILRLYHIYRFFVNSANGSEWQPKKINQKTLSILDNWILERIDEVSKNVTLCLENFDIANAISYFFPFIEDLSTWYVRRSRDRIGPFSKKADKETCLATLHQVLEILTRLMAPFTPFISDYIYRNLTNKQSVHLSSWPLVNRKTKMNRILIDKMAFARKICEVGNAKRKELKIKTRQPLNKLKVKSEKLKVIKNNKELIQLIKEELNVKKVEFEESKKLEVEFDTKLTPLLIKEGEARGLIRKIQEARKKAETNLNELVTVYLPSWPKEFEQEIKKKTLAKELKFGKEISIQQL